MEALGVVLGFGNIRVSFGEYLSRAARHGASGCVSLASGDLEIGVSYRLFGGSHRGTYSAVCRRRFSTISWASSRPCARNSSTDL